MKNRFQIHALLKTAILICLMALINLDLKIGICDESYWYTQGEFRPTIRIEINLINHLDFDRKNTPVIITREQMPIKDIHELWITVVDPSKRSRSSPSKELLALQGGHQIREETNGFALFHQLDDLDKDGIWDELFFVVDIKANETKKMYLYMGFNQRGWNEHSTHAAIGSYCRHLVPFWESAHVGWKLWYPTDCDVYAKRKPLLMSHRLYMENLDGYGVSGVSLDLGSDIMSVANSFGGGGICLFEYPDQLDQVSRPRFSQERQRQGFTENFNVGQISDTRYAYDVVVNGPLRSMIKVKTMNWNTEVGSYSLEQIYTAYAEHNYSTCQVRFTKFYVKAEGVQFGCGIRKRPGEELFYQEGGIVVTAGKEEIRNPDVLEGEQNKFFVEYAGTGLVVKDCYEPSYCFVPAFQGNHTFRIPVNKNHSFEYLIAAGWSEGSFLKTKESFLDYVIKQAKEYNHPIETKIIAVQKKI